MERAHLDFESYFDVVIETDEAQAAEMTVAPGRTVGGPENYHEASDQWLFVHAGTAVATVDGEDVRLEEGDLIRIAAGERHGIENDGDEPFETLNVYTPPR